MDLNSVIIAIFGTLGSVAGAYFVFRGKKVESLSEVRINEINKNDELDAKKIAECMEEKKLWKAKEEELKELISEYAHNWADAVKELKEQTGKIERLEKRITQLETSNKKWQEKEKEWIKKENKLLQEIFKKK